jgi:hypothetical protein
MADSDFPITRHHAAIAAHSARYGVPEHVGSLPASRAIAADIARQEALSANYSP